MKQLLHKAAYACRFRWFDYWISLFRKCWFSLLGMQVGKGTLLPRLYITWPHKITIGKDCKLEQNIYFKFDGIWSPGIAIEIKDNVFIGSSCEFNIRSQVIIGNDSLIASGCRFIDHDHGIKHDKLMRLQEGIEKKIIIGTNVWLGCNVIVLKGVKIGDGAIVGAGAVVTKTIPPNEIWGGIPARKIGVRA